MLLPSMEEPEVSFPVSLPIALGMFAFQASGWETTEKMVGDFNVLTILSYLRFKFKKIVLKELNDELVQWKYQFIRFLSSISWLMKY